MILLYVIILAYFIIKKKVYIYYYVMFINIPIFYPLSNHLCVGAIEPNTTTAAIDNITLESVSNLSLEWCCIWLILWEDNGGLD